MRGGADQITIAELIEGVKAEDVTLDKALKLFESVYMASRNLAKRTRQGYRLHTGCQWDRLSIDPDPDDPEKKKSVMTPFTIIFASAAAMEASKRCGRQAF